MALANATTRAIRSATRSLQPTWIRKARRSSRRSRNRSSVGVFMCTPGYTWGTCPRARVVRPAGKLTIVSFDRWDWDKRGLRAGGVRGETGDDRLETGDGGRKVSGLQSRVCRAAAGRGQICRMNHPGWKRLRGAAPEAQLVVVRSWFMVGPTTTNHQRLTNPIRLRRNRNP